METRDKLKCRGHFKARVPKNLQVDDNNIHRAIIKLGLDNANMGDLKVTQRFCITITSLK